MKRNFSDKVMDALPLVALICFALIFLWNFALSDRKVKSDAAVNNVVYASSGLSAGTATQPLYTSVATAVPTAEPTEVPPESLGVFKITAYCPCEQCCPGTSDGITSSGTIVTENRTIATDALDFGTVVIIDGQEYIVEDRIGCGEDDHIDVYMDSHEEALIHGVKYVEVFVSGGSK